MGGGASSQGGLEELITTTYMIGRAIAAVTFPGLFRIYDFHSPLAPKLKNATKSFSFFAAESDEDDDDYNDNNNDVDPSQYAHFFSVVVGEDTVYLENPLFVNECGWQALHTCCMSFLTVNAGIALIDETVKQGGSLDLKTYVGPGTFNKGWSPLQMAASYGVEPLVEKLIKEGANVNTTNSFGSTPLLDACHRGFTQIVQYLVNGGANISYIPSSDDMESSPFLASPPHCALGEASRCGFFRIVEILLNAGASKDQCNFLGWTPLHEACFYNRTETVKILLLAGANASIRTKRGALPYHLAGLQLIRQMLTDIGGPGAVPNAGDIIDTIAILRELTGSDVSMMSSIDDDNQYQIILNNGFDNDNELLNNTSDQFLSLHDEYQSSSQEKCSDATNKQNNRTPENKVKNDSKLLHSGDHLGDLPSLNKTSTRNFDDRELNKALEGNEIADRLFKADDKNTNKKKKNRNKDVPPDMPTEFLCQLSQKPMTEPVKSIYGNVYEKGTIVTWIKQQGHICPLTGAPLSESDLKPQDELGNKIRSWILKKSMEGENQVTSISPDNNSSNNNNNYNEESKKTKVNDDLYDF